MTERPPSRVDGMRARSAVAGMTAGTLVSSGASAGAALWATRALPVDDRGIMVIAVTIAVMLALLGSAGTNAALRARLGTATGADRLAITRAYTGVTLLGAVAASVLAALACWASASIIDARLGTLPLCLTVGLFTAVQTVTSQVTESWFADGRFFDAAKWAAAGSVGGLIGIVVASSITATTTSLLLGQCLGTLAGFAGGFVVAHRAGLLVLGRLDRTMARDLIVEGWPSLGYSVGLPLALRGDRYLLGIFAGPRAVAVYALAATLGEVPRTVPNAIGQLMGRRASERKDTGVGRSIVAAVVFALATAAVISIAGWFLIPRVFGEDFSDARVYAIWLFAAEIAFVPFVLGVRVLLGRGRARWVGTVSMGGGVLACAVTVGLVPWAGILGACIASIIAYGWMSLVTVRAAYRLVPVEVALPDTNVAAP
jgi:O-antigen/teichoic acid export membrane protein